MARSSGERGSVEGVAWEGLRDSTGQHRTVGPHRAWCLDCGEWCYPAPELRCRCCDQVSDDPTVRVARSVLIRWANAVRDEVGLDAVAAEIGAVLSGAIVSGGQEG